MLTKILPYDVEQYIFEFLIMPLDTKLLKSLSKSIRKMVKTMPYMIEKERITNKIFMLNEDNYFRENRPNMHPLLLSSLADCWNNYHQWAWITPTRKKVIDDYWTIGEFVDALDKIDVWGPAYIKDIKIEPVCDEMIETRRLYHVEFLGWTNNFDEWIPADKIKKLGTKTFNPLQNIDQLEKTNSFWILHNEPITGWRISICSKIKVNKQTNTVTVNLQGFYSRPESQIQELTFDINNISNHLKYITNISSFLCVTEKSLDLENRKILM